MAYNESGFGGAHQQTTSQPVILQASSEAVNLPSGYALKDADFLRSAMDLQLVSGGREMTIENYFAFDPAPVLQAADGFSLSPQLVSSFVKASPDYASTGSLVDESPVGVVDEVLGGATVTRVDGTTETVRLGIEIYQGDIVETAGDGAVNIVFVDDTSFAVSEDARLAIDEYVYDPVTESGSTDFSVLKGVFVYTSGAIGRDDPDDVTIETPVGSIGIRGTIIAGDVDQGEITVVEGAIVLRDFGGNEVTLANQFETARFDGNGQGIEHMGQLAANDVVQKFSSISNVAPDLFSSMKDAANENGENGLQQGSGDQEVVDAQEAGDQADGQQDDAQADADNQAAGQEDAADTPDGEAGTDDAEAGDEAGGDDDGADQQGTAEGAENTDNPADTPGAEQGGAQENQVKMTLAQERGQAGDQAQDRAEKTIQAKRAQLIKARAEHKADLEAANQQQTETKAEATQNEPVDPASYQQHNTSDNHAPRLVGDKFLPPESFFHVGENTGTFEFFFDQVFYDLDGDDITYRLAEETVKTLNDLSETVGGNVLNDGGTTGSGWDFNPETGHLTLYVNDGFAQTVTDLELTVVASDGEAASHYRFLLSAYDEGAGAVSGYTVRSVSHGETVSDNEIAFVDDGASVDITVAGINSEVHLGEGGQKAVLAATSDNNTVIGGNAPDSNDYFVVHDADNNLYGMDGSDTVELRLDSVAADSTGGASVPVWDGGWNDETTAQKIVSDLKNGSFDASTYSSMSAGDVENGDTIKLHNGNNDGGHETVDFSEIDVLVKNIENIELVGADATNDGVLLKLNVDDVIKITDQHNTLTIGNSGAGGQVELTGFSRVDANQDGTVNQNPTAGTSDSDAIMVGGNDYNVYVGTGDNGQQVTLLIDADVTVTHPV